MTSAVSRHSRNTAASRSGARSSLAEASAMLDANWSSSPSVSGSRHVLGRRSEAGFLAEVARDWGHLFPVVPHQSEANRRIRWLAGAFEQLRALLAAMLPEDDCQQVDTSAIPVKRTSRVRAPRWLDRPRWAARPVRPGRRARRVVLRVPAGHQDRPRLADRAGPEHRARRRQRARRGRGPARNRACAA